MKNKKWLLGGIALALLNVIVFNVGYANRPIGASTAFPYVADVLTGFTSSEYFQKIATPGNWEVYFLFGALIGAFLSALISGTFRIFTVPERWKNVKGPETGKRFLWAFVGGFVLILGARMAGGCTSGHILSGGMQLSLSSLIFGGVAIASTIVTGKLFYRRAKND